MIKVPDEIWQILTKVVVPALVAVSVGIAVKMKRKRVTIMSAVTSYIIGVGMAFIFGFVIMENITDGWSTVMIGTIAITGEKIGYWLIFRFKFDAIGDALMDALRNWINKK